MRARILDPRRNGCAGNCKTIEGVLMPCREGKISGGRFLLRWIAIIGFSGSILILLGITIGGDGRKSALYPIRSDNRLANDRF